MREHLAVQKYVRLQYTSSPSSLFFTIDISGKTTLSDRVHVSTSSILLNIIFIRNREATALPISEKTSCLCRVPTQIAFPHSLYFPCFYLSNCKFFLV